MEDRITDEKGVYNPWEDDDSDFVDLNDRLDVTDPEDEDTIEDILSKLNITVRDK